MIFYLFFRDWNIANSFETVTLLDSEKLGCFPYIPLNKPRKTIHEKTLIPRGISNRSTKNYWTKNDLYKLISLEYWIEFVAMNHIKHSPDPQTKKKSLLDCLSQPSITPNNQLPEARNFVDQPSITPTNHQKLKRMRHMQVLRY